MEVFRVSEINANQRKEKIVKMKLQTAKVLWGENRKDATFLLLESIDDPRGDDLRERMGFDDEYEVGNTKSGLTSPIIISIGAVVLLVVGFLLGTFFDLNGGDSTIPQVESATNIEDQIIETIIAPTPEPGEPLTQPLIEMTGTASQVQQTQSALATQQGEVMNFLDATDTAAYEQATATESARETQAAGGN